MTWKHDARDRGMVAWLSCKDTAQSYVRPLDTQAHGTWTVDQLLGPFIGYQNGPVGKGQGFFLWFFFFLVRSAALYYYVRTGTGLTIISMFRPAWNCEW